jgi:glycogen debranching enzyme
VARASLAYVVHAGFDNGSDGHSLPAVAIWDHVLATGDESLARETWERLSATAAVLDGRFDEYRGLVAAAQSTSNDAFEEPEVDGFALSTEVYSMQTYEALSRMAALPGIEDHRADRWGDRAAALRANILDQYWNPEHGFFTSGPRGSEAFARGYWETSGAEAALWGFLGEKADRVAGQVLQRMREVAMSDYGVVLFPYRERGNHFTGSVWYCWQAGIARAAARVGDAGLIRQLVGQQARTVVRNKTFYEVTDAATGDSWRWPGQLWHAAGFVSLLLSGVLGIRYDVDGMTFTPAVAPEFAGTRLERLRYRSAELNIEIRGHGTQCRMTLDGQPADRIPVGLTGRHTVVLAMQ